MIKITKYQVVNGEKSDDFPVKLTFKNNKEVEEFRKILEMEHHCFVKDFKGWRRVKDILFEKKEKITKKFVYHPPEVGSIVKVYVGRGARYGIAKEVKIIENIEFKREVVILKECEPVKLEECDYCLDENKVKFVG